MTRPTKERLEEIKNIATQLRDTPVLEVFAEIDALIVDKEELLDIRDSCCKEIGALKAECDRLRALLRSSLGYVESYDHVGITAAEIRSELNRHNAQAKQKPSFKHEVTTRSIPAICGDCGEEVK